MNVPFASESRSKAPRRLPGATVARMVLRVARLFPATSLRGSAQFPRWFLSCTGYPAFRPSHSKECDDMERSRSGISSGQNSRAHSSHAGRQSDVLTARSNRPGFVPRTIFETLLFSASPSPFTPSHSTRIYSVFAALRRLHPFEGRPQPLLRGLRESSSLAHRLSSAHAAEDK